MEVRREGIVPMAALARAGSVVALLVLLAFALVSAGGGFGAGPTLASGHPVVQAASASPGVAPADAVSAYVSADRSRARTKRRESETGQRYCRRRSGGATRDDKSAQI